MAGMVSALAGRVGALNRNFSGMVGASSVVAGTVSALVVRVSALVVRVGALSRKFCGMVGASSVVAGRVGALAGAISAVSGLV